MRRISFIIVVLLFSLSENIKAQSGNALIDAYVYNVQSKLPLISSDYETLLVDVEYKDKSLIETREVRMYEQYKQLLKRQKRIKKETIELYMTNENLFKFAKELIGINANLVEVYICKVQFIKKREIAEETFSFTITYTPEDFRKAMPKE